MPKVGGTISEQHRKISETFLAFSAPLLETAGIRQTKGQIEKVLKIAFTVWNSVEFDTIDSNNHFIDRIRELVANDPEASRNIEEMITRKKTLFSDDHRLIGGYRLTRKNGEWNLWAEARLPQSTRQKMTEQLNQPDRE
jgi:hypothetical protein